SGTTTLPDVPLSGTTTLPDVPRSGTTTLPDVPRSGTTTLPDVPRSGTTTLPATLPLSAVFVGKPLQQGLPPAMVHDGRGPTREIHPSKDRNNQTFLTHGGADVPRSRFLPPAPRYPV